MYFITCRQIADRLAVRVMNRRVIRKSASAINSDIPTKLMAPSQTET